ncbi:MAG TPA: hypothetical protein VIX86_08100 [Streptosporangiaceae bacterium]
MMESLALAAAAGWLLAFGWSAVVTARPPRPGAATRPEAVRPALVNLAVTRCRLDAPAYPATILDLAARGYLVVTEWAPGQLWCEIPAGPIAGSELAPSESLVLAGVRALAGRAGAPFEVLADSCVSDVQGRWDPFDRAVRAEGRQAGLARRRLPVAGQLALSVGAVVVGMLAFLALQARLHSGLFAPLAAGFFAIMLPAYWAGLLARRDRLTGQGAALGKLAAQTARETAAAWGWLSSAGPGPEGGLPAGSAAELSRLAAVVAAGVPVPLAGAVPGRGAGARPRRRLAAARRSAPWQAEETPRPGAAWSSLGGQWRLVPIQPLPFGRTHPVGWLLLAAWLALMTYLSSLLPGPWGTLLPIVLLAAFAAAAVIGVRRVAAWLAQPLAVSFHGQVIARWVERRGSGDDDVYVPCLAVDDGERAWSFGVSGAALGQLSLGDPVAVRASPRTGRLLSLVPDRPAAGTAAGEPAEPSPLLSAEEVEAAVGRPIRATGVQAGAVGAVYRGDGITVIVTVAEGRLGLLSSGPAKRSGRPLPGPGDEAWLVSRDRTIVFRQGSLTAKVTIGGSAAATVPPDVLPRLAATVAGRLPRPATTPGPPGG